MRLTVESTDSNKVPQLRRFVSIERPTDELTATEVVELVGDLLIAFGYHTQAVQQAFADQAAVAQNSR